MVNISVPYNPVPDAPQNLPTPYRTAAGATPEAFGAGVGESLQRFGAAGERLGDMLSSQSLTMQDLANRSATDKLDTQFMTEAGAEHAKYNAMQGAERANYYPTYQKNLTAIREKIGDSAPNAMVRRMYDSQTLRTLGQTIFNGAGAAATAMHEDAVQSLEARQAANEAWTAAQTDPAMQEQGRQKARALSIEHSKIAYGLNPDDPKDNEAIKGRADIATSRIDRKIIEDMIPDDLEAAKKEFEKRKLHMSAEDQRTVSGRLENKENSDGATQTATDVIRSHTDPASGAMKPGVTHEQIVRETRELAEQRNPKNKAAQQAAVAHVETQWREKVYGDAQTKNENMNVIYDLVNKGARNTTDVLKDPDGKRAYDGLPPKEQAALDGTINRIVQAKEKHHNDQTMEDLAKLRSRDNTTFVQQDPFDEKWDLSHDNAMKVNDWIRADLKTRGPKDDPRAFTAFRSLQSNMGAEMARAGVLRARPGYDPDKYDTFMMKLTSAITAWTDEHDGRPPSQKDIQETIGKDVLKETMVPRGPIGQFFGMAPTKEFEFEKKAEDDPNFSIDRYRKEHPEASDEQMQRDYARARYLHLYEKKTSAGTPAEKIEERFRGR